MSIKKNKSSNPLLDALAMTEPQHSRCGSERWYVRLEKKDPETFQSIVEIVKDFHAGGEAFRKLQNIANLHRWLIKQDVFAERIGYSMFRQWAQSLRQ